ncbi:hypothetical protein L1049_013037 [Liquidambar formosana]|uniref:RING-type E3 ubiquitin transferase n=1 Tax=Liquidambar formosana TaxID=63359 RepID=A0AAP0RLC1_LIQFO
MASYYQDYTFLSCPTQLIKSRFTPIDCLSNSTTSVLASSSMSFVKSMSSRSCNVIASLPIPISWPVQNEGGLSSDLGNDLVLSWNVPDCRDCESQGGMCGLESNTSQEIGCFYDPGTGDTSQSGDGLHIFKILVLSITIPAITSTIAIALFICFTERGGRTTLMSAPTAVTPQPTIVTTGLDDTTIESYTKLVLGESRRLPGPNDITCPICLSEYRTKETLRCIPECKHCFHADCIDEWLRLNGTCPVCRMSPSPTHVN